MELEKLVEYLHIHFGGYATIIVMMVCAILIALAMVINHFTFRLGLPMAAPKSRASTTTNKAIHA